MTSQLDQIKAAGTIIVADTGEIDAIRELQPTDATTNPTLLMKAITSNKYSNFVDEAIEHARAWAKANNYADQPEKIVAATVDYLYCIFGREIMKVIKGYVSTEIDARLSFDTHETVCRGRRFLAIYKELGCDPRRVLLKIASTYEGLQASKILEADGIKTNCTLLFSKAQAVVAAESNAFLVSPFVGRITDWYMKKEGRKEWFPVEEDPGVVSVRQIFSYYKQHNIKTIVMGASFRHKNQCVALCGCDRLTISPNLMRELMECKDPAPAVLSHDICVKTTPQPALSYNKEQFEQAIKADPMADEKLHDGIKVFSEDAAKVEALIKDILSKK